MMHIKKKIKVSETLYHRLKRKSFLKRKSMGAILIEFAFAVPILIIILFFILDVPLAYRISQKLQKTSELYAQMLMNLIQCSANKTITTTDLINISRSVGFVFTGVYTNSQYPFHLSTYVTRIKGKGGNNFNITQHFHIDNNLATGGGGCGTDYSYSTIEASKTTHTGNIKSLIIQQDEEKILVETVAWYKTSDSPRGFNKGFYLLTIPGKTKNGAKTFGDRTSIITPHKDLVIKS
jgi:hypothetical protein